MTSVAAAHPYSRVRLDRLVGDIESALLSGDRVKQSQIVRRSADLLVKYWSCLPMANKPAFDGLLQKLAGEIDAEARSAFASRLAPLRRGPPLTIKRLARDPDGAVAASLLESGLSLQIEDFREIAVICGDTHRCALARRRGIGPELTDLLLTKGGLSVAIALAENASAGVSPMGFAALLRQAARSERLTLLLMSHADLGEANHAVLLGLTLQRAATALEKEFAGDRDVLQALLGRAQARADESDPFRVDRFRASVAFIASSFATTLPEPDQIKRWVALNRIEDVLAALAHAAGLPIEQVVASYDTESGESFALIARGLDWPWELLKDLLQMRRSTDDRVDVLNAAYATMRDLTPLCARRLVRLNAAHLRIGAFAGSGSVRWPELQADDQDLR